MSRRARLLLLLVLLLAPFAAPSWTQAEDDGVGDALDGLSGEKALALVKELAADEMKGRKTAYEGGSLVENWLLGKFSEFGLHPADAGGTYLEPFTYGASNIQAPIEMKLGDKALVYGSDYQDLSYTGSGTVTGKAVFVGYGISRPDLGWDDYDGVDVKGKVVIAIRGAPKARASEFPVERAIGYKSSTVADKGAIGFLLVEGEKASSGTIQDKYHRAKLPALWISANICEAIMGEKPGWFAETKAAVDGGTRGKSRVGGTQVSLQVNATYNPRAKGHNALGDIRGRDPDLNHEIILVGAHMDHLGVDAAGRVYNGADDNASGTAVLTHLADVLTANRFRPKRRIIFCAFGAEEQGLVGSKALAARYPFQGEIVAVLNMDMVGQGEPAISISGVGAYPRMHERMKSYLPKELLAKTKFGLRTGAYGDHWPFHERGIPSFFIGTKGKHPNYHTIDDDVANIKADCLEATARTLGTLLVKLALDPEPLAQPNGIADYLVREGPLFTSDGLGASELEPSSKKPAWLSRAVSEGASNVLLTVQDPAKAWEYLEKLEKGASGAGPIRLIREASDVSRALNEGRLGVLPCLVCGHLLQGKQSESGPLLSQWRKLGYRVFAPFHGVSDKGVAFAQARPILEAAAQQKVLLDLGGLAPSGWAEARRLLGTRPAIIHLPWEREEWSGQQKTLVPLGTDTLRVAKGHGSDPAPTLTEGLDPAVMLLDTDADSLAVGIAAWGATQPAGWDLPGSPQRKAIRGLLGGRLVEWLARSER